MLAKRRRQWPLQIASVRERFIERKDFPQQQQRRPPVRQKMVNGPYAPEVIVAEAKQSPPHQRRLGQGKSSFSIGFEIFLEATLLILRRQVPPIVKIERQIDLGMDELKRG